MAVKATNLDEVVAGITLIGQVVQQEENAATVVSGLQEQLEAAAVEVAEGTTALILISDADRNLYAAKPQSYTGGIAALVGLDNPAAELADSGTFPGFALVSAEQIITMDPTFIFTITPAPPPAPRLSAMLPRIPGFSALKAVQSGQVHELDTVLFVQAPGPRIAEAVAAMAQLVKAAQ